MANPISSSSPTSWDDIDKAAKRRKRLLGSGGYALDLIAQDLATQHGTDAQDEYDALLSDEETLNHILAKMKAPAGAYLTKGSSVDDTLPLAGKLLGKESPGYKAVAADLWNRRQLSPEAKMQEESRKQYETDLAAKRTRLGAVGELMGAGNALSDYEVMSPGAIPAAQRARNELQQSRKAQLDTLLPEEQRPYSGILAATGPAGVTALGNLQKGTAAVDKANQPPKPPAAPKEKPPSMKQAEVDNNTKVFLSSGILDGIIKTARDPKTGEMAPRQVILDKILAYSKKMPLDIAQVTDIVLGYAPVSDTMTLQQYLAHKKAAVGEAPAAGAVPEAGADVRAGGNELAGPIEATPEYNYYQEQWAKWKAAGYTPEQYNTQAAKDLGHAIDKKWKASLR